jgi:hypothetical protein
MREKILSFLLKHFYRDYVVVWQTKHTSEVGLIIEKPHALIMNCSFTGFKTGIKWEIKKK